MKKLLLALALVLLPSFAWAQCTGVFPPNTLCGNLSGSPQPPGPFTSSGSGNVVGPVSSTANDIAVWNNISGTLLKDVPFLTICGSNIFSSSLVGCVPASGGGTTNFLRADGAWATLTVSAGVDQNILNAQAADYTIANTDCGSRISSSGGLKTITLPAVAGFATNCRVSILDNDTRGKKLSGFPGNAPTILFPNQEIDVAIVNGAWAMIKPPKQWRLSAGVTLNVDSVNGNDANDGLATGTNNALATYQKAYDLIADSFDISDTHVVYEGSISGTVLTVTKVISGKLAVGQLVISAGFVTGNTIAAGTTITSLGTGTGGTGTYNINNSQTVAANRLTSPAVIVLSAASQTYTNADFLTFKAVIGQALTTDILFDGNSSTFNQTSNRYAFSIGGAGTGENANVTRIALRRMTYTASSGGALNANGGTLITLDGINYGAVTTVHMSASGQSAQILALYPYTISGNAVSHATAFSAGFVFIDNLITVTLTGTPNFSSAFATAEWFGQIYAANVTWSGSATGQRYLARFGGIVDTQTGNQSYLPGNTLGTATNSIYDGSIGTSMITNGPTNNGIMYAVTAGTLQNIIGLTAAAQEIDSFAGNANTYYRRANGSVGSPSALALNDSIGGPQWLGYGTSAYSSSANAAISASAAEAWTNTNHGTYLQFFTTPTAGGSVTEAMRLFSSGGLSVGTTTDPGTGNISKLGDLKGTATNDSAAAGGVGEYISSTIVSGSAVALTTNTQTNLTSISLTAGDWDVWCEANFLFPASTSVTVMDTSISQTSATLDQTPGNIAYYSSPAFVPGASVSFSVNAGPTRKSYSTTTTTYCVVFSTFTVSTESAWGILRARRVR